MTSLVNAMRITLESTAQLKVSIVIMREKSEGKERVIVW